jgi:hypothetical protein
MSASIQNSIPASDEPVGIDFGDYFSQLVGDALEQLVEALNDPLSKTAGVNATCVVCYTLKLERIAPERKETQFVPYGIPKYVFGDAPIHLPDVLPIEILIPDIVTWTQGLAPTRSSLLAASPANLSPAVADFLSRVQWHAQLRLQQGNEYVGYFKVVAVSAPGTVSPASFDAAAVRRILRVAHFEVMEYVASRKRALDRAAVLGSPHLQSKLEKTLRAIPLSPLVPALRHVANLITSHHGAHWNRACLLTRTADGKVVSAFAQGGLGNREWSDGIQTSVAQGHSSIEGLIDEVHHNWHPGNRFEDPYFLAVTGEARIELEVDHPECPLAQLWRNRGSFEGLQRWIDYDDSLSIAPGQAVTRDFIQRHFEAHAIKFSNDDPWVRAVENNRRLRKLAPVFISKSSQYWCLPWRRSGDNDPLIGLWLVDCCYWHWCPREHGREPPSLLLAHLALDFLADSFARTHRDALTTNL